VGGILWGKALIKMASEVLPSVMVAILPYLALRQANPVFSGERNGLIKLLDSRWFGLSL
jgi:hypothetical protein